MKLTRPALVLFLLLHSVPSVATAIDEAESLALLVATVDANDDPAIRTALMRGMLKGLEGRRSVDAPDGWWGLRTKLAQSEDADVRKLAMQLSQIFGDTEAIARSLAVLKDGSADVKARRSALRSLLIQQNEDASSYLETLLDEPELRLQAVRGYAAVENAAAPAILLERYQNWSPDLRRAVVEALATRKPYAQALLSAVQDQSIPRADIPAHVARSLSIILGDRFESVFGKVRPLAADREKLMEKYRSLLTPTAVANADASRGRAVFKKTCASCHFLYDDGAKIGPDLTGSNRANLDYILLNSVDPSYDVPVGYRMVTIVTNAGRVLNGVIGEEDATRVVLKTVEQPRVVILKSDIDTRKVSDKSMMPEGQFGKMKPQELIDLIRYLRTTEQVELPQ